MREIKTRIPVGTKVNMPKPKQDDNWQHGFMGRVKGHRHGNLLVEDQVGDVFEVEGERVTCETAAGLPDICMGICPGRPQAVFLKRGELGYYPSELPADDKIVNEQNEQLGVTRIQRTAMEYGSMFGWHIPGADPVAMGRIGAKLKAGMAQKVSP